MISPGFLTSIYWEERWLELEAEGEGEPDLPGYAGSTLRGALGAVMRPELCATGGRCGEVCEEPERCRFYSLFEQSRARNGHGANIPKPLILEAPGGEELRAIALGAAVSEGFELSEGRRGVPVLTYAGRRGVRRIRVGLRALGAAGAALDGVVEGVRRKGLEVKGGRLRLTGVEGGRRSLADEGGSGGGLRRLRLALTTPLLIRDGEAGICLEPARLGRLILDQAAIRAATLFNTFFARGEAARVPFFTPEWPGVTMTGHRLFQYRLPRHSYRQGRWMDFDGMVGWIEWEGETGRLLPWLRAAEVLHIGQKATFGLGRVEVVAGST